jgi:hypothetical protein
MRGPNVDSTVPTGPYAAAARIYHERGWTSPIPVTGKHPPLAGYTGYDGRWVDADECERLATTHGGWNIANRVPPTIIGIDIDAYNDKNGAQTIEWWAEQIGVPLPPTIKSTSRDDGISGIYYFTVPAGTKLKTVLGKDSGVEVIQWFHRYAVCWPTIHPDTGRKYVWYGPDGIALDEPPPMSWAAPLPVEWIVALSKNRQKSEASGSSDVDGERDDDTFYVDEEPYSAADVLANGIKDGEQNTVLYSYLSSLRARGSKRAEMMSLGAQVLRNTVNSDEHKPWTEDDLVEMVDRVREEYGTEAVTDEERRHAAEWMRKYGKDLKLEVDDESYAADVLKEIKKNHVRRAAKAFEAAAGWRQPSGDDAGALDAMLCRERAENPMLITGLMGARHNVSLTAQYKTGKTTLGLNVVRALVDDEPFLGQPTRLPKGARVTWLNGEMDADDFVHDYAAPLDIRNAARIHVMHLRGLRVPLLSDVGAEWMINELRRNDTGVWLVDSWRRLLAWNGIAEIDNAGIEQLTVRIDEIKKEAGVAAFVALVHTGRAAQEEGAERARGGTALDDWVDQRWLLTRGEGGVRFFYADGRAGSFGGTGTALTFDEATHRIELGVGNRSQARAAGIADVAAALLLANGMRPESERERFTKTALNARIRAGGRFTNQTDVDAGINEAERAGRIHWRLEARNAHVYYAGSKPQ